MPYVVALKPSHAWRAPADGGRGGVGGGGRGRLDEMPSNPGRGWRWSGTFAMGIPSTWWALEGVAGPYGPDRPRRLVIATPDPATLPEAATWYLETTLPVEEADLAEVVRLYGLRHWVEQAYKQVKDSLGWSQYQVRSDAAMRRHWALVQCAFAFCWWAETRTPHRRDRRARRIGGAAAPADERGGKGPRTAPIPPWPRPWRCWPRALRQVRAWLEPAWFLWRCWRAWTDQPPPPPLQALLDWLLAGHPLSLYDSS